jgi:hypothetical protein
MRERPLAVLDANVLYPFQTRNFLLHLAAVGLYQPLWSARIVEECERALRRDAGLTEAQCAHLFAQMRAYFGFAWGAGFERRVEEIVLPDRDDRHVVALAAEYEAELIVTHNLRHFPGEVLHPLGITAIEPDAFAGLLWNAGASAVIRAAERHRNSLRQDPLSPEEYLETLDTRAKLPRTARLLRDGGFLADSARLPAG